MRPALLPYPSRTGYERSRATLARHHLARPTRPPRGRHNGCSAQRPIRDGHARADRTRLRSRTALHRTGRGVNNRLHARGPFRPRGRPLGWFLSSATRAGLLPGQVAARANRANDRARSPEPHAAHQLLHRHRHPIDQGSRLPDLFAFARAGLAFPSLAGCGSRCRPRESGTAMRGVRLRAGPPIDGRLDALCEGAYTAVERPKRAKRPVTHLFRVLAGGLPRFVGPQLASERESVAQRSSR